MNLVKNIFGNYVPELSLHESLSLEILNSQEFQKRGMQEQNKIRKYLESNSFKTYIDSFENFVENPSACSFDFEWK